MLNMIKASESVTNIEIIENIERVKNVFLSMMSEGNPVRNNLHPINKQWINSISVKECM